MKVLLFGASGMVGQGVLRECLLNANVQLVQVVGRSPIGVQHPKLREFVHKDMWNYASVEDSLVGFDVCFFCIGASAAMGTKDGQYESINYGIPMAVGETLVRLDPQITFIYVSTVGTDRSESGRRKWARIRGRTENALLRLPFKTAYILRPSYIAPAHGERSRTRWYRILYTVMKPVAPLLRFLLPNTVLTTEELAKAMLALSKHGASKRVLECKDIHALASLRT